MQQHSSISESRATGSDSNAGDLFRDGCKTIMSILVILTNDCGKYEAGLQLRRV